MDKPIPSTQAGELVEKFITQHDPAPELADALRSLAVCAMQQAVEIEALKAVVNIAQ